MKKSIYELEKSDYNKYIAEFNNTEFGKKTLNQEKKSLYAIMIVFVIFFVIAMINVISGDISGKEAINTSENFLYDFSIVVLIFSGFIYAYNFISRKICFYRWLKIKHNIEY